MIPVEIKLNDFEEYVKNAKFYIKFMFSFMVIGYVILVGIAVLIQSIFFGVVASTIFTLVVFNLSDPVFTDVLKSYKTAKLLYKSLFNGTATPVSFKPMSVEGFYNKEDLTYNFKCKVLSHS